MRRRFALLALSGLILAGCSDLGDPVSSPPPEPPVVEPTISFAADVEPILLVNCQLCHVPEMSVYDNLVGVEANGYGGLFRVAAGDTANSVAYQKINGNPAFSNRMPLNGQLLPEQIATIGTWIVEGALEN